MKKTNFKNNTGGELNEVVYIVPINGLGFFVGISPTLNLRTKTGKKHQLIGKKVHSTDDPKMIASELFKQVCGLTVDHKKLNELNPKPRIYTDDSYKQKTHIFVYDVSGKDIISHVAEKRLQYITVKTILKQADMDQIPLAPISEQIIREMEKLKFFSVAGTPSS